MRKTITSQNRQMEDLTKNLEEIVNARSKAFLEKSEKAKENLKEVRLLLKFIKEISVVESFDEVLGVLKTVVRKFHGVMPPALVLRRAGDSFRIFHFRGPRILEKKISSLELSQILKSNTNSFSDQFRQLMSNLFSRPMGPLKTYRGKLGGGFGEEIIDSVLFFENSLSKDQRDTFEDFIQKRLPLFFTAIETLFLRERGRTLARQWSTTFSAIPDPILIISKNLELQLSNKSTNPGACYSTLFGRDKPCLNCPIAKHFNEVGSDPKEHSFVINHENKIYRVNSFPIAGQGEEPDVFINQYTDITEQTALQGQVVQSEKVAAIGMLAGNVAHELNNPLTGIASLAELLIEEVPQKSNVHSDLQEVKEAAVRCQKIIKDLLEFSNLDLSGVKTLELNSVVQKTLPFLKMGLRPHRVEIHLTDLPLHFKAQSQLIQQVIFNLINNACQAMDEGGLLKVETKKCGSTIELRVSDTGKGIPDSIKESIFQPFFTTKAVGVGTGLGLSMSRQIVESIGGKLTLPYSTEEGSQFLVELPICEKGDDEDSDCR